jgi:beta-phosphoglucomutase
LLKSTIDRHWSPQGIVFDMDGVLLNSSAIHAAAYREVLREFTLGDFCYTRVAGMRSVDGIRAILKENGIDLSEEQIGALAARKSKIALAHIVKENPIVPGARDVLEVLSMRARLALASSASPASVNSFLDRNHLRPFFQCVLHSGDVRDAKPSPEIFELAIRRLDVAAANSLVVEDAVSGILAAKAAGAVACGIPSTSSAEELERAGADLLIERLDDLLDLGVIQ